MRQLPQLLPATALNAHGLHGHLYGVHHGLGWHDEASDDDIVHAPRVVVQGLLAGIQGEPEIAISQVLRVGKSSAEDIRHYGRFYKQMLHGGGCLPNGQGGCLLSPPLREAETDKALGSSAYQQSFTLSSAYTSYPVNARNVRLPTSRPAFISRHSQISGAVQ